MGVLEQETAVMMTLWIRNALNKDDAHDAL